MKKDFCAKEHKLEGENLISTIEAGKIKLRCRTCRRASATKYDRKIGKRDHISIRKTIEDHNKRFWLYVNKSDKCWLWTGAFDVNGYGDFRIGKKHYKAHIYCYRLIKNIISSLDHQHTCEIKACVNPDCIALLTRSEHNKLTWLKRKANKLGPRP